MSLFPDSDSSAPLRLTVFYDGHCLFCRRVASWLQSAELEIPIELLDLRLKETECRYPDLQSDFLGGRFVVLADDGRLYFDTKAKLMVLYATKNYRETSYRLAAPLFYATTDSVFSAIASGRFLLGSGEQGAGGEQWSVGSNCETGMCRR